MENTISADVNQYLAVFKDFLAKDSDVQGQLRDELSRFKVWCGTVAAHRTGRSSLEHRLRDASHIRDQVLNLVRDLTDNIEANLIVTSDQNPPVTELNQIATEVADVINCLTRLNVAIRNPAPHQRFIDSKLTDTASYEPWDIRHVESKFSQAKPWLVERLGKLISRRRQYFRYRESHHAKLSAGLEVADSKLQDSETVASSIPSALKDIHATGLASQTILVDDQSDAGVSETSYGASTSSNAKTLKIPPLREEHHRGPFQCPYCYMMVAVEDRIAWERHIYSDLRPYTCLEEHCVAPEREFSRRHEWFEHVQRNHWKTYNCPFGCEVELNSILEFKTLAKLAERAVDIANGISCPLCSDTLYRPKQYQRHVGRHLEQLSLFALPVSRKKTIISRKKTTTTRKKTIMTRNLPSLGLAPVTMP
ncbi:hypothetical protein QBC35DRAFT_520240 [Podospora australis]|uniref:C2H2-type domain-containing protein n=1 Tax=Podospora australis TaxID=1536484 RepID=A0AAN6X1P4_9PEZI|nr:hypothetical protein QBC35DRAFT_520240 [Podospora australis]